MDTLSRLRAIVGPAFVRADDASLDAYGHDALDIVHRPDVVVIPGTTEEVASIARWCDETRTPLVVRGAGTGYTGGAVPTAGGVLLSMERFARILEIDEENLLAVVEPAVVTGVLQDAVEPRGLFYPPDPASFRTSSIGGNVAECAGGPRAFKYGTTKRYVLGLEAVLATGEIIHTGSKTVKNVVGYDLTQTIVGSEGTLAIITKVILRLVPKPPARGTVRATFASIAAAAGAVTAILRARVVPAALELIDRDCIDTVAERTATRLGPEGTEALLLVEVDGTPAAVDEDRAQVEQACREAGALEVRRAASEAERDALWAVRREISLALKATGQKKVNHDVVVPRGRVPALFALVADLKRTYRLRIPCFGHAGDGNIHVNLMFDRDDADAARRAEQAARRLFEGVVALEGSISGEHGIGFAKAPYVGLELGAAEIALSRRLKAAFDPHGILNPGKIFG